MCLKVLLNTLHSSRDMQNINVFKERVDFGPSYLRERERERERGKEREMMMMMMMMISEHPRCRLHHNITSDI